MVSVIMDLNVIYNGDVISVLNSNLIKLKRLDTPNVEAIKAYHILKEAHIDMIRKTNDPVKLKKIALNITNVEYCLQELWKFEKDSSFHKFWLLPKCSCPKMDNEDSYGTGYSIRNTDCLLHGE